jgi:asparagine synthase (glutamine-hydrolysing)
MCGIAGIVAFDTRQSPTFEQIARMCDRIAHRGPDDWGYKIQDSVALGMRRLSIIDLGGGKQPLANETGTILTVFNGEIYNFRELRQSLQSQGHIFTTNTDTEVIVHAYEQYGSAFPRYLNGMFAIALHDTVQQKLFLVRDHIGIKPLYYAYSDRHLVWGSEIKAILASGVVERSLDLNALSQFLAWEYVPGEATLFQQIRKLKPGSYLEIDLRQPKCQPVSFWDVPPVSEESTLTAGEWEELVADKLKQSVQQQLVSDVPLGAFLSGGVDSSLIVAAMGKTQTFSIGFESSSYNELAWAQMVAEHLQMDHISDVIQPDVAGLFEHLMYFMDDPIGDFSIFPTYLVSQLARQQVKVVLSGDGGDELFGGYEAYLADDKARLYGRIPQILRTQGIEWWIDSLKPQAQKKGLINKAKRFLEGLEHPEALSHARWRLFAGEMVQQTLFTPDTASAISQPINQHILELFQQAGKREPLNRSLYVDVKSYLCDNILTKVDRMSMAVSLEARVPYLDRELVELAFRIPTQYKVSQGRTKILLKTLAAQQVPPKCVYRPKEGFSIPIKQWLKTKFRPILEDYLQPDLLREQGLFQPSTVERLKQEHFANQANHSHLLWSLIVFQAWYRRWFKG